MSQLVIVDDPLFGRHVAPGPHPERPERLDAIRSTLAGVRASVDTVDLAAADASDEDLRRVHDPAYVEALGQLAGQSGYFDPDTFYGPESIQVARRAAGASVALADALCSKSARAGAAIVRPPGHHARPGMAMGFCLLNNAAVAAARARANGARRVLILDFDVHHGNGTEEIFYGEPSVLYVSLHQYPFYPGTGAAADVGAGEGAGYNVNVPLSAGATDAVYEAALDRIVGPIVQAFDPDVVFVSAGFDAHERDPLAMMRLTATGYATMCGRLLQALPRPDECGVGVVLEGGYDLAALGESMAATLLALSQGPPAPSARAPVPPRYEEELARVRRALGPHWKLP